MQATIVLTYHKSTPGTHVFQTSEKGVAVKSIYVNRDAFDGVTPGEGTKLRVTVETIEGE